MWNTEYLWRHCPSYHEWERQVQAYSKLYSDLKLRKSALKNFVGSWSDWVIRVQRLKTINIYCATSQNWLVTWKDLSFWFTFRVKILSIVRALCVIFTILVSFSRDNALFASKAKINVFWKFFERSGPEGASGVRNFFKKRWF